MGQGFQMNLNNCKVMGIVNATPDSFYANSRSADVDAAVELARLHISQGAHVVDIGGQSTRPGADAVGAAEELARVLPVVEAVANLSGDFEISIDTFYAVVAEAALDAGAHRINDVSAGRRDPALLDLVRERRAPYILMHAADPTDAGVPGHYRDVVSDVTAFLAERLDALSGCDVWLDPGLGFGKTSAENFSLLRNLGSIAALGAPVMVGLSRKRLVYETLASVPEDALNGTTFLHAIALSQGAHVLRVHDVAPAVECLALHAAMQAPSGTFVDP